MDENTAIRNALRETSRGGFLNGQDLIDLAHMVLGRMQEDMKYYYDMKMNVPSDVFEERRDMLIKIINELSSCVGTMPVLRL